MGYQLVASALQPQWGGVLTSTERLCLLIMCQVALDDSTGGLPPRTFWGGTEYLILMLRGDVPAKGSPEYGTAKEQVRRALRKLEAVGAIKRSRIAVNAMRAEYTITVHAPQLPVDNPPDGEQAGPLQSGPQGHFRVALRATSEWPSGPLQSGPIEGTTEEQPTDKNQRQLSKGGELTSAREVVDTKTGGF